MADRRAGMLSSGYCLASEVPLQLRRSWQRRIQKDNRTFSLLDLILKAIKRDGNVYGVYGSDMVGRSVAG